MGKRIVFMSSAAYGLPALEALRGAGHEIVAVYTQPPRPAGRGMRLSKTPVHEAAEAAGLEVRTPEKLRGEALAALLATPCDAIVVVAYGLLLPAAVVEARVCLNIHPSALPRWRGPAPVPYTLMHGDAATEVCVMRLDAGMDTGPVYARVPYSIGPDATMGEVDAVLWPLGAQALLEVLATLETRRPVPQALDGVTLTHKITKEQRMIDLTRDARDVHNHIRALTPAFSPALVLGGVPVKIRGSRVAEGRGDIGEVLRHDGGGVIVACGTGAVWLGELQVPGKTFRPAAEVLAVGDRAGGAS